MMTLTPTSFLSQIRGRAPLRLRLAMLTGAVLLLASGLLLVFLNVMFRQVLVGDVLAVSGNSTGDASIFVEGVTIIPGMVLVQLQCLSCVGFIVVAFFGGSAAYVACQWALHPLVTMSREAHNLTATRLHHRLTLPQTRDELYQVARSFNEVLDRLERTFVQQNQFLDEVAHELRTPLAIMYAQLEQAVAYETDTQTVSTTTLNTCLLSLKRLEHLIESLLVLARTTTTLPSAPVAMVPLAEEALTTLDLLAGSRQVALRLETTANPQVVGNDALLLVVVVNLVKNGILYNRPYGNVTLKVAEEHREVVVTVSDSGVGIPAEALPHIFERFYRVPRSGTTGGVGLGLAIVADVVALHGGTVTVTSDGDHGSTFVVRLPRAHTHERPLHQCL